MRIGTAGDDWPENRYEGEKRRQHAEAEPQVDADDHQSDRNGDAEHQHGNDLGQEPPAQGMGRGRERLAHPLAAPRAAAALSRPRR
jgi:hypothetical protein